MRIKYIFIILVFLFCCVANLHPLQFGLGLRPASAVNGKILGDPEPTVEDDGDVDGDIDGDADDGDDIDTDGDGIVDREEERLGTYPDDCDSDGDGVFDGVEVGVIKPATADSECHGLEAAGTNYRNRYFMDPLNPDSDGDDLLDGEEDLNGNGWVDTFESDPSVEDTDRDGINDGVEANGDFNGDGIPDFDFHLIMAGPECSPPEEISDLDCDGMPNWVDIDSDEDGCPDQEEGGRIDRNSNGIPDVFDNEATQCEEDSGSGVSFGGSGTGSTEPADSEPQTAGTTPAWLRHQGGGAPCSLIAGFNDTGLLLFPGLFYLTIFFFLFYRRVRMY